MRGLGGGRALGGAEGPWGAALGGTRSMPRRPCLPACSARHAVLRFSCRPIPPEISQQVLELMPQPLTGGRAGEQPAPGQGWLDSLTARQQPATWCMHAVSQLQCASPAVLLLLWWSCAPCRLPPKNAALKEGKPFFSKTAAAPGVAALYPQTTTPARSSVCVACRRDQAQTLAGHCQPLGPERQGGWRGGWCGGWSGGWRGGWRGRS